MALRLLATIFLTLCTATLLTMLYVSKSRDPVILVQPDPLDVQDELRGTNQCLTLGKHSWKYNVKYGRPGLLINPSKDSDVLRGSTTDIVNRIYNNMCPGYQTLPNVQFTFPDILLIVDFNHPAYYNVIPYLELLYRRYFPNILYCGLEPETLKEQIVAEKLGFPIYYLQALKDNWQTKYECIQHAMKMCDSFSGYLLIGDDTLINMTNFQRTPKYKAMVGDEFVKSGQFVTTTYFQYSWQWWGVEGGRSAMLGVLNELAFKANRDNDHLAQEFLRNYYSFVKYRNIFYFMPIDFLYVPKRLSSIFLYMTSLFRKYKANVEVAIPFFVCGLQNQVDVHFVRMLSLWGNDRGTSVMSRAYTIQQKKRSLNLCRKLGDLTGQMEAIKNDLDGCQSAYF
ncbi:uncharacterized protein LOC112562976 [Pomacea canaliculata]|uniref:uncharacterized protein LOC112562976 n=1 Tax=Pomacea canaliculata TaxID=400727 RepID=UPI000D73ED81|nr:uncharacterized protein LOC112562976 [Pomacea canaliculata]XP_025092412.1 uncharacterized protein LOC112562976 [Pomacea canaliculata]